MRIIEQFTMPNNTGKSFIVKKGQRIGIRGYSTVDTVVLNFNNIRERFDQARTKAHNGKVFLTTGDRLYTKWSNVLMTITKDTYKGTHDLQYGMCSKIAYDGFWKSIEAGDPVITETLKWTGAKKREDLPDHGCWENLQDAFKGYDIAPEDIPSPFNIIQSMEIVGREGKLVWQLERDRPEPGKPAYIELRAEMDCLTGLSACPDWLRGKSIDVTVFEA
jgi:uncharacterized protein YcgI (DUF1989 family)